MVQWLGLCAFTVWSPDSISLVRELKFWKLHSAAKKNIVLEKKKSLNNEKVLSYSCWLWRKKKNQKKGKVGQKHWELVRINCDNSDSLMERRVRSARQWTCKLYSHLFNGGQKQRKVRFITQSKTSGCISKFIWKLFGPGIFCRRSCFHYKFNSLNS